MGQHTFRAQTASSSPYVSAYTTTSTPFLYGLIYREANEPVSSENWTGAFDNTAMVEWLEQEKSFKTIVHDTFTETNRDSSNRILRYDRILRHESQPIYLLLNTIKRPVDDKPSIHTFTVFYPQSCIDNDIIKEFREGGFVDRFMLSTAPEGGTICLLVQTSSGLELEKINIKSHQKTCEELALSYGEEFLETHEAIVDTITNNSTGLYMFYGAPGAGKTSYIKYLSSQLKDKLWIFIPTGLTHVLTSPEFIPLLLEYGTDKEPVIILEDAEKAVESREHTGDSGVVATLLNLTDGIVGTLLNTSVICTYNTSRDKIDVALLRKGRLKYEYEFKPLSVENTNKLLKSLGVEETVKVGMTLADIYNYSEETFEGQKPPPTGPIGFGV